MTRLTEPGLNRRTRKRQLNKQHKFERELTEKKDNESARLERLKREVDRIERAQAALTPPPPAPAKKSRSAKRRAQRRAAAKRRVFSDARTARLLGALDRVQPRPFELDDVEKHLRKQGATLAQLRAPDLKREAALAKHAQAQARYAARRKTRKPIGMDTIAVPAIIEGGSR